MSQAGVTRGTGNTGTASATPMSDARGEPVCDQQFHTKVEDRPVIKETVTQIREHHPIEKEFVVETRPTGREKELTERAQTEVIDTKERIISTTPRDPCAGVEPVTIGGGHTGHHGHHGHHSGTGTGTGTGTGIGGTGIGGR